MSFIVYNLTDDRAIGVYDTEKQALANVNPDDRMLSVIEYEWKETDYLVSIKLNADGVTVSNKFPGKTIEEQKDLIEIEDVATRIAGKKKSLIKTIKLDANDLITELNWKKTKARDADFANGNSDAITAWLNERNSIRIKSNEAEVAVDALTTEAELQQFNVKEQFN
jgi:hypothetical protein